MPWLGVPCLPVSKPSPPAAPRRVWLQAPGGLHAGGASCGSMMTERVGSGSPTRGPMRLLPRHAPPDRGSGWRGPHSVPYQAINLERPSEVCGPALRSKLDEWALTRGSVDRGSEINDLSPHVKISFTIFCDRQPSRAGTRRAVSGPRSSACEGASQPVPRPRTLSLRGSSLSF